MIEFVNHAHFVSLMRNVVFILRDTEFEWETKTSAQSKRKRSHLTIVREQFEYIIDASHVRLSFHQWMMFTSDIIAQYFDCLPASITSMI